MRFAALARMRQESVEPWHTVKSGSQLDLVEQLPAEQADMLVSMLGSMQQDMQTSSRGLETADHMLVQCKVLMPDLQ